MSPTRYCNELVVDPVTGQISFPSTSYQEFLRRGQEIGICAVHGAGVDVEALADRAGARETVNAIPIKSKAPLLLGFDPYNSETPILGMVDESAQAWMSDDGILLVEDTVRGEREAFLKLPPPPPFQLPIPTEVPDPLKEN
jgi:hypothetical protein